MNVAVIGCGGTGSFLLPLLARMLDRKDTVTLMDGDAYTEKNLDRQLFDPEYVGKNKAMAMAETYGAKFKAVPKYLKDVEDLKDFNFVFGCPDNHIARALILEAADAYGLQAVICGNEYESAAAMYYSPAMRGGKTDPRVRYPELLTDRTGSPVEVSCTGEAAEESPQLVLANSMSATYAMSLAYFWVKVAPESAEELKEVWPYCPVEHTWVPSKVQTLNLNVLEKNNDEENSKSEDSSPVSGASGKSGSGSGKV